MLAWNGLFVRILFDTNKDLKEIQVPIQQVDVAYFSERHFASDRFDIYAFSLSDPNDELSFEEVDEDLFTLYDQYWQYHISKAAETHQEVAVVSRNLDDMMQLQDTVYKQFQNGSERKLYLYNKDLNKGYCLIFTI